MRLTQNFIDDMRYLRQRYGWTDADVIEIKEALRDCEPLVRYFTILAAAHRAGYEQHAGNGFVRLQTWCIEKGLPDPYTADFDPAALDAL